MTPAQLGPLKQRLDTLESFMVKAQTGVEQSYMRRGGLRGMRKGKAVAKGGNDWTPEVCSIYTLFHINL